MASSNIFADHRPAFEKKEVFVIWKTFDSMKELKSAYKKYREEWISKHPNETPPAKYVEAWSAWGVWENPNGDVDYCVIWTVKLSARSKIDDYCRIGHETAHCFLGNYHNDEDYTDC